MHVALLRPAWLLPLMVVAGILCSRPTFVGERYPWLGPTILMGSAAVALVVRGKSERRIAFWPVVLVLLAGAWSIVHEMLVPESEPNLWTTFLTFSLPLLSFHFIARDLALLSQVSRALVAVVSSAAVLTAVSVLAGLLIGWGRLHIGSLPLGYERINSGLLLPGSLIYGSDLGNGIPRFLGLGREPGMGAIFIGWAYFAMPKNWRWRKLLQAALLVALAATQSTTGIGLFGVALAMYWVWGQKRFNPFVALVGLGIGCYVAWIAITNPDFGFLAKFHSSGTSFIDRNKATQAGLDAFVGQPFTATTDAPLSSINLIATAAVTGAPWVVLIFLLMFAPVWRGMRLGRMNPALYSSALILVTMVSSQPVAGSTAILVLVLMNYYSIEKREKAPQSATELPGKPSRRHGMTTQSKLLVRR